MNIEIQPLPIKDYKEPLYIKGKRYFVIGTGTAEDGGCIDTLKSESTGAIRTFPREVVLKSIDKPKEKVKEFEKKYQKRYYK